jgi:hypothetical protein
MDNAELINATYVLGFMVFGLLTMICNRRPARSTTHLRVAVSHGTSNIPRYYYQQVDLKRNIHVPIKDIVYVKSRSARRSCAMSISHELEPQLGRDCPCSKNQLNHQLLHPLKICKGWDTISRFDLSAFRVRCATKDLTYISIPYFLCNDYITIQRRCGYSRLFAPKQDVISLQVYLFWL